MNETLKYKTNGSNGYIVEYTTEMNGGGMMFGLEYVPIIKQLYPNKKFKNCLEWCSGPGFIAFNLLDNSICENVVLHDLYEPALKIAEQNAIKNNITNNVKCYLGDEIDVIPKIEKFDLVVANPPHYDRLSDEEHSRVADDPGWRIHKDFYNQIGQYLTDDGAIIIQENGDGSSPEFFHDMILNNNLNLVSVIKSPQYYTTAPHLIYYMVITK